MATAAAAFSAATLAAAAPPPAHEPTIDADGNISQKIIHRTNPFSTAARQASPAGGAGLMTPAIRYNGGPIMANVSKIVVIWYGNWNQNNGTDTPAGQQIIRDAIYGLSQTATGANSNWVGTTTGTLGPFSQATGGSVSHVASPTILEVVDPTNSNLNDSGVFNAVKTYGGAPDPNAIYLVLSSSNIRETSGFLSKYCGWHTFGTINGTPTKYGFIGNPNSRLSACAIQAVSPNGNPAVDGMVSVISHELEETVTDPQLNAWFDSNGAETGDKCAWTFGSHQTQLASGAWYNVTLPTSGSTTRNYQIQRALSPSSLCYVNATGQLQ
jgi:hypothetical protein